MTGAGSGLGRAFCRVLADRGASLVVSDVDLDSARETSALLPSGRAHALACDVANPSDVRTLAKAATNLLGGVDLVINNAGVAVSGRVGDVPLEDWKWIIGVNLWGVIHGCDAFVPMLRAQGSGHIINVASAAGLVSMPEMAPYNATKAAVVALSETLRAELRGSGVGVSVLCPTFFETQIFASARRHESNSKKLVQTLMAKSKVQALDVARIALDAADADEFYIIPQIDGRWLWRMKRLAPGSFPAIVSGAMSFARKRAAKRRDERALSTRCSAREYAAANAFGWGSAGGTRSNQGDKVATEIVATTPARVASRCA